MDAMSRAAARRFRRVKENTLIIGVDPGIRTGLAVIRPDGSLYFSHDYGVWDHSWSAPDLGEDVFVFAEIPQNGTYISRGGVYLALGMVLKQLRAKQDRVHRIYPREWRNIVYGPHSIKTRREEYKGMAEQEARRLYPKAKISTDNQAEAILIARYGWILTHGQEADA